MRSRATVQSPRSYDLANLTASQLGTRLAAGVSATLRANLRAAQQDTGYHFAVHPNETTAGLVAADLRFGYDYGHLYRYGTNTTPGTTDMRVALQRAIDSAAVGGTVELPDAVVLIGRHPDVGEDYGVKITRSITLRGTGGREDFDNSWDTGGGSVLRYDGDTGDAIYIEVPTGAGNNRLKIRLHGFVVQGARVTRTATATAGRCIMIDGKQESGSAIHVDFENLYVAEAVEEGLYLTGAIYGGVARGVGATDCGKNGIRVISSGSDAIGEMCWMQVRVFSNGDDGADAGEQAGLYYSPGQGSHVFLMLSCSENSGYGAVLRSGSFQVFGLQMESNVGANQLYIGSDGAGAGVTHAELFGLTFAPEPTYTGTCINITSDAARVRVCGVSFANVSYGVGGKDFAIAGPLAHISGIQASHVLTYSATATDAYVEGNQAGSNRQLVSFHASRGADVADVTGDDTTYTIDFDSEVSDVASALSGGIFTAPVAGKYLLSFAVTLGGILSAHDRGLIVLQTTGGNYLMRIGPTQCANALGQCSWTGSYLVYLAAGDTARVTVTATSGTKVVDVIGGGYTWFSGALVVGA